LPGGLPRVYEISKDFRNEGIDRMHSPEFTMMECYAAWVDYIWVADLVERLVTRLADRVLVQPEINFEGKAISLKPPFRRETMANLVRESCGIEIIAREREGLAAEARAIGLNVDKTWGVGKIIDEIFSEKVEPNLIQPTFVLDYPVELSPLAKKHRSVEGLVERFETIYRRSGSGKCLQRAEQSHRPVRAFRRAGEAHC
jgi:lysyl-tRNA synthetase class 2